MVDVWRLGRNYDHRSTEYEDVAALKGETMGYVAS